MIRRRRCKSCGGHYQTEDPEGVPYYHACAPVGVDAEDRPIERPKKRDENIDIDAGGEARGIKHEGDGAEDV